jgi:hypothetical protein
VNIYILFDHIILQFFSNKAAGGSPRGKDCMSKVWVWFVSNVNFLDLLGFFLNENGDLNMILNTKREITKKTILPSTVAHGSICTVVYICHIQLHV